MKKPLLYIPIFVIPFLLVTFACTPVCPVRDRVETPLLVDMEQVGIVRPRDTGQIESSRITVGCEVLDREFADFDAYKEYLQPLGIKKARLQSGWARIEKERGVYDFAWLDEIVDYLVSIDMTPWMGLSYGNPIYDGGGEHGLFGVMPSSEDALAGWDRWVEAIVDRYKDRVFEWEIWNEPFSVNRNSPETTAHLNIRTAEIIKRIQPDAKIAGLALGMEIWELDKVDAFMKIISDAGKLGLFTWISYHPYEFNPDDSYTHVENFRAKIEEYSTDILIRQGENGAPSTYCGSFALWGHKWTEYSQAKWNLRRCLGDLGRNIETQVFSIIDMAYRRDGGIIMNVKGLIQSNEEKVAIRRKVAYYSMQHLASIFDDSLEPIPGFDYSTDVSDLSVFGFRNKASQKQTIALWFDSEIPNDLFTTKDVTITVEEGDFDKPVWVDVLSGRIYEIPASSYAKQGASYTFTIPAYDSPVLIADASSISIIDISK